MRPIRSVDELRTAIELGQHTPEQRRDIVREARRLGRCDILPRTWNPKRGSRVGSQDVEEVLAMKAETSGIAVAKLRCVYMRGAQEYDALTASALTRDAWAQARVNSFIRLASGSSLVRRDDADLLAQ